MKTYWLQQREARTPIHRSLDPPVVDSEIETTDRSLKSADDGRRAGVYSPITFQDVARRSIASSPIKESSAKGNSLTFLKIILNNFIFKALDQTRLVL